MKEIAVSLTFCEEEITDLSNATGITIKNSEDLAKAIRTAVSVYNEEYCGRTLNNIFRYKGIVFDCVSSEITKDETHSFARICETCAEKNNIAEELRTDKYIGTCGVAGCENNTFNYIVLPQTENENEKVKEKNEKPLPSLSLLIFEGVVFDGYEENTDLKGALWGRVCSECAEKHHIRKELLDEDGSGTCCVKGCNNEADYYIDFSPTENIKLI